MSTYTTGYSLKSIKNITKNDIITMCNLLNNAMPDYKFEPEPIIEGGICYKFYNKNKWYKTVRLNFQRGGDGGDWGGSWPHINKNVMKEWVNNSDILLPENRKITTFLKSFYGAPSFTTEELKIWEKCFDQIGLIIVGRYPTELIENEQNLVTRTLVPSTINRKRKMKTKNKKNKKRKKMKKSSKIIEKKSNNTNNTNNNDENINNSGIVFDKTKNVLICLGKPQKSHNNFNNSKFENSKPTLLTTLYFYEQGLKCFICKTTKKENPNNVCSKHDFVCINLNTRDEYYFDKFDFVQCKNCKYLKILVEKKNNLQTNDQCIECLENVNECLCQICNSCITVKECFKCVVCSECEFCKGCNNCSEKKKKQCICDDDDDGDDDSKSDSDE